MKPHRIRPAEEPPASILPFEASGYSEGLPVHVGRPTGPEAISRRDALKRLCVAGGGIVLAGTLRGGSTPIVVAGQPVEIAVWSVGPSTVRISVRPSHADGSTPIPHTGALVNEQVGTAAGGGRDSDAVARIHAGETIVRYSADPPTLHIETRDGKEVQRLKLDAAEPGMSFLLGAGPLLGLGEGGAQFDRRGAVDEMRSGQGARSTGPGAYALDTHGTRAPVQWLIGTRDGWALFIHQPYGSFDLTGREGRFTPRPDAPLPLDIFVVCSHEPQVIMREYARITGLPELPPRWALGYMQSSRTLAGPEEILGIARTFREKRLPCDALIFLGTPELRAPPRRVHAPPHGVERCSASAHPQARAGLAPALRGAAVDRSSTGRVEGGAPGVFHG